MTLTHCDTDSWLAWTVKGIAHFEIKIWYLSAYPKGIHHFRNFSTFNVNYNLYNSIKKQTKLF